MANGDTAFNNQERKLEEFARTSKRFLVAADRLVNAAVAAGKCEPGTPSHKRAVERYERQSDEYNQHAHSLRNFIAAIE